MAATRPAIEDGSGLITFALDGNDFMVDKKCKLIERRGLKLEVSISEPEAFDKLLQVARILELNETEYYFLEDDEKGPFSLRNELAALTSVRTLLSDRYPSSLLLSSTLDAINEFDTRVVPCFRQSGQPFARPPEAVPCARAAETALLQWCKEQGVKTNLFVADFDGYGRGCATSKEIQPGDLVLEIPKHVIISEDVAMQSQIGKVLLDTEDIAGETISLLWSLKESMDESSFYASYFSTLPKAFNTGLSFGVDGLQALDGKLLFEQIVQTKEHIRAAYHRLFPALSEEHPELFPKDMFTWERFLWASELWYSNGVKISFPDGNVKTCLVPLLGLLNHSSAPHITHYSKLDVTTNTLKLHSVRRCEAGQQCYLSYGTLSNADFLCFYGFVLENPYDTVAVDLEMPDADESSNRLALFQLHDITGCHMVRARWLSKTLLTKGGIPSRLVAALRILSMDEEEAATFVGDLRHEMVSVENEAVVSEYISQTLRLLSEALLSDAVNPSDSWDARLAMEFQSSQRAILESLESSVSAES